MGQKRAAEYQVPIGAYVQVVEIFLRGDRHCVEMLDAEVDMGAIEVACTDLRVREHGPQMPCHTAGTAREIQDGLWRLADVA